MKNLSKGLALLGIGAYLLSVAACSKSTDLGLSLVEQERSDILFTDTVSLQLTTFRVDPLVTSNQTRTICGAMSDPVFGSTESSIFMNFRINSTNVSFPTAVFDSIVLMLVYDSIGHYGNVLGDNMDIQTWEVVEMTEDIELSETYKSDATFALGNVLGEAQFIPNIEDSLSISEAGTSVRKAPHLRIRLDQAFGESLLHPSDPTIYNSNDNFKAFFKGLCIRPKAGQGNSSLIRFRSKDINTKMTMYYTDTVNNTSVAKKFDFLTNEDAESVMNIVHDYTGTDVLSNSSTDTVVYLQGMGGVGVRVDLSAFSQLGDIIVNQAELEILGLDENTSEFPATRQLICTERLSDGTYDYIDDVLTSFSNNRPLLFGGIISSDSSDVRYTMNISKYMQRVVNGDTDEASIYIQSSSVIDLNRLRLGNQRSTSRPVVLRLTYTRLD